MLVFIAKDKEYAEEIKKIDDWVVWSGDYLAYKGRCETKIMKELTKNENEIKAQIPALKKIKNELLKNTAIPLKYTQEKCINGILALLLDKRANSLKEAINLYETEVYRGQVIKGLATLNQNIIALNSGIAALSHKADQLGAMMYVGLNTIISQNAAMMDQLQSIDCSTKFLMVDRLLG